MKNELLTNAKTMAESLSGKSDLQQHELLVVKLIDAVLPHIESSENLDKAPERFQLYDAVWNAFDHRKGLPEFRRDGALLFRANGIRWAEVDFGRLISKWIKDNRITAGMYALLEAATHLAVRKNESYANENDKKNRVDALWQIGRTMLRLLVASGMFERALSLYDKSPDFADHSSTAAALLGQAICERRLDRIRDLREKLASAVPTHPLVAESDAVIRRLIAYSRLQMSHNIAIEELNELNGTEFEHLLTQQFVELGYQAQRVGGVADFGADIKITTPQDTVVLVQCKRFRSKVNLKAVQEVVAAIAHYGADTGIVITNSGFLASACKLADSNNIELWDKEKLALFLTGDLGFSALPTL